MSIIPYSAIFIDVNTSQYMNILSNFFKFHKRDQLEKIIEKTFVKDPKREQLFVNLSVRTAFDLFLQAVKFPAGSEIIMTGINIPDMATVVREHGLHPIPTNVRQNDLAPYLEEIEKAITPDTKAIMVSYIYGASYPIDDIIKLAKKHNIYVLEDLAETFTSLDYNGHPEADVSLFSFGTIKYNSALGGALTIVRNNDVLYRKMKHIHDKYPMQPTKTYFTKCLKTSIPAALLNTKPFNKGFRTLCKVTKLDYKEYTIGLVRGFPKDGDFLPKFRYRVCTPLLANLAVRMQTFDIKKFNEGIERLRTGQEMLVNGGVEVLGSDAENRSFWLFPILVPDVLLCYKMLNDRGVDAYLGATQLRVLENPEGPKYKNLDETSKYFNNILYLPLHINVPADAVEKICKETIDVISLVNNMQKKPEAKL